MKKTLSLLLAVIMIAMTLTAFPITVNAVDVDAAGTAEGTLISVGTKEELTNACNTINANGGNYTIKLTANISGGQIAVTKAGAVVTVVGDGDGKTISATQSAVYVSGGAKVILGDGNSELTLTSADNNDTPGIVHVLTGSFCTMKNQVTLRDHDGQNYLGGGVTVDGGTFVMDGGTITNCSIAGTKQDDNGGSVCYGGGVAVFNGGTFTMNNGTITECKAKTNFPVQDYSRQYAAMGGGVFVSAGSTFTMNNGTISKCEATNLGGGVAVVNHDSPKNGQLTSKAEINGGIISGNEALGGAGVFVSGFVYAYAIPIATGAEVNGIASTGYSNATNALLGAAPSDPGLYIEGGTITDNKATGTYSNDVENSSYLFAKGIGGGVLVYGVGTPVQIHNAKISSNHADHGAGVASFYYWTNADIDGCTITDNIAKGNGGGVYLANKITKKDENTYYLPKATIKDTTITGNSSGDRGAGVYYIADTELHISGRDVIQNNTFNGTLNNLNVLIGKKSTTGSQEELLPVYVDGALSGSKIGLSDPRLWDDNMSDIDAPDDGAAELLTNGYKEYNPEVHPSEYFTSDHETWIVERSAKTTTEVIDTTSKPRYQFNAKRYSVTDKGKLAGLRNQLVIKDIKNPDLKDSSSLQIDEIVEELKYPYSDITKYSCEDKSTPSVGSIYLTYKPLVSSSSPFSSIVISKAPNAQTATISYYVANGGGWVTYSASTANQSRYANTGELVLEITQSNTINTTFNTEPDTFNGSEDTTVEYLARSLPRNPGNILYDYDENGYITAKYVIEKPSDYTQVQNKTIIEGGEDEVRLVRKKPDYHINNEYIDDNYKNNDIFTPYVEAATKEIKVGETIGRFYTIPEVVPTKQDSCPYIFKGWYYDQENDNDSHPVKFGTDKYAKDIYAHWIKVEDVAKDENDLSTFQKGGNTYGGFDLPGVNIRKEMRDYNFDDVPKMPGGMRFITSLSMDVVNQINAIQPNNIEYGYVAATAATHNDWIEYHRKGVEKGLDEKLKYVSETANGIDTSSAKATDENYFGFAKNIDCTSKVANSQNGVVRRDHQNFDKYLLYSLVITYEEVGSDKGKNVLARPYIKYTDANGSERVAYSDYRGTNVIGGCYTSYNYVVNYMMPSGN